MDADFWGGIALLVVLGAVGAFSIVGAVVGRRKGRTNVGGSAFMVVVGLGFLGGGIGAFSSLTLTPRHNGEVVGVTGRYQIDPGGRQPVVYRVVTPSGIFETFDQGLYESVQVGHSYRCSVRGGYTGAPSLKHFQAQLESCRPA